MCLVLLVQIGCTLSVAAFHIIGLTKIPKTEFVPLDWIYRSVRIMMVNQVVDFHRGGSGFSLGLFQRALCPLGPLMRPLGLPKKPTMCPLVPPQN